ncbi:hypothetical protein B0H10DRAFT_1967992 [Mycena sp. CBHHK59/15]|nr:hypothetical protein B0H10DRAFT_1967992 [Mycena sp. CBHHK59/15]
MELTKTAQKKLLQNLQKLQSAVGPTIQLLEKSLGQDAMTKTVKLPVSKRKVPSSNANITKAPQKKTSKPASTKAARGPTKKANGQASNAKAQENERHAELYPSDDEDLDYIDGSELPDSGSGVDSDSEVPPAASPPGVDAFVADAGSSSSTVVAAPADWDRPLVPGQSNEII